MRLGKDMAFGVLAVLLAGAYWYAADDIQRSFLSDEVGADGVPKLLAATLGALGAIVLARAVMSRSVAPDGARKIARHLRALGLLLLCGAYVALMPTFGYFVATAALIGAVALYAGQPWHRGLLVTALAGSAVLWLVFDHLLGVSLPPGFWLRAIA